MHCIQLIARTGGSTSILEETPEACRQRASMRASKDYLVATVPFPVMKKPFREGPLHVYDVSLPEEIRTGLGVDIVRLYAQQD